MSGVDEELAFAAHLADVADRISRAGFESRDFAVRLKPDGSAVTDVDVHIEEALARELGEVHPSDEFLSEELGLLSRRPSRRRWIVDGIDGTAAFIEGRRTWGTLIALQVDDEVQVGVASSPGLGRRWWAARGSGAWMSVLPSTGGAGGRRRLSVSVDHQASGIVAPLPGLLDGWRDDAVRLAEATLQPTDAAGHGPLLVAAGEIDISVHLWGGPWDHAPFVVLVEEAGGTFTDLWGGRRIDTATAVFSNGIVHEPVRRTIATAAPPQPGLPEETA